MNQQEIVEKGLGTERRRQIREMVRERRAVRVDELCTALGVSPATIRRDLEQIERVGSIRRVHGGAVSVESRLDEPLFDDKTVIAAREKLAIAQAALERIDAGDTIYLDGGSTVLELARMIRDAFTELTVVTNSLRAAIELSGRGPRVILIGGELRRRSQTLVGPLTRQTIEHLHFDKAFMGTIGLTPDEGMTTTDPGEAYTKELAISRATTVILLAHGGKIGRVSFAGAGRLEQIQTLITDQRAPEDLLMEIEERGIEVVRCQ